MHNLFKQAGFLLLTLMAGYAVAQVQEKALPEYKKLSAASPIELINEANKLADSDASGSMKLASAALEKSLKENNKPGEYYAYNTLGTLYFNIGNYDKAVKYLREAYAGFNSLHDERGKAYAGKYLTLSLEKQKRYEEALNYSYAEKDKVASKEEAVNSSYTRARLNSKAGRKKLAIFELNTLAKDSSITPESRIKIYNELGDIYVSENDTARAFLAYGQVFNYSSSKAAAFYSNTVKAGYLDAVKKVSDLNLSSGNVASNLQVQSLVMNEGLASKDPDVVQLANYNIGNTFLKQDENQKAIPYLAQSASIARGQKNPKEEQRSVRDLAHAYENLGEYHKALDVYKRYIHLTDSFKGLQKNSDEASLTLNREFLKQEERIKDLIDSENEKEASIRRQRKVLWALGSGLVLFLILTWALVRNIRQKQRANLLIKLQSLRTQMNPHFIFNSLNSVNNFIARNDERSANKYLADFSKLMRMVLKNSDEDFVTLATEIQTLQLYLDLEHFRFGNKFEYTLEVDEAVMPETLQVPPMLIQPHIENAIWHGLRYKDEKGILQVRFYIEDKKLFCSIYDNGIGRKKSAELKTEHQKAYQSTGIKNTQERIEILNNLHKTSLGIVLEDLEKEGIGIGTLVKISLPYKQET